MSAACSHVIAPLKARMMTSWIFMARSTAAAANTMGTSLVAHGCTPAYLKSGHFICSRERTDHVLPTPPESGLAARPAFVIASRQQACRSRYTTRRGLLEMAARSLRDLYDEFRAANGIRDNRPGKILDEGAMSKLMQLFLAFGVQVKASDIHFEPILAGARVRYRIDGILHDMLTMSPEMRDPLVRAIKVRAGMTNDGPGRSKPQDSRFDFEAEGHNLDLRLSSFPTLFGDVIAIRILDRSRSLFKLEDLGFPPTVLKTFEALIKRPNGFVLVTGPTGVGKTTTLYAALNKIRSPRIKVVTLEDPVEY